MILLLFVCGLPVTRAQLTEFESIPEIDAEIELVMGRLSATAASVAIGHGDQIVYCQGYGFSDRRGRVATSPRTTMRLASCTKPFTAAAIRELIAQGAITEDTPVYQYLDIRPQRALADERLKQITVAHLLDHRGGWDRSETFDPMYQLDEVEREMRTRRIDKRHIVRFMWQQPLQFAPGSDEHYSNFGYLLLGLIIEKATGKSYVEAVRDLIGAKIGSDEFAISSSVKQNRKSREVHYPEDNSLNLHLRDSASGLATNPETLCRFMQHFWMDGNPRVSRSNRYFFQFGSHPFTTTTLMEQRRDGINYAIMWNRRRNDAWEEDNEFIRERFNRLLDDIGKRWTEQP